MSSVAVGVQVQRLRTPAREAAPRDTDSLPAPALTRGISHAAGAELSIDLSWSVEEASEAPALTGWELDTDDAGTVTTETLPASTTSASKLLSAAATRTYRVRALYGDSVSESSTDVSSALAGETMRVALDVSMSNGDLYNESPAAGSILAGSLATTDGLAINRVWSITGNTILFLFRAPASTVTADAFLTGNSTRSLYVIAEDDTIEFPIDDAESAVSYVRFSVTVGSAAHTLLGGLVDGDDIALIVANKGQL